MAGIPEKKRRGWWMLMLQAYLDGSQHDNPPIYVLAGYLAPADQWAAFSNRWQEILDLSPSIPYFRMTEIRHRLRDKADERIALCREAIEDFIPGGFSIGLRPDAIRRIWGPKDKFASHPIYCAFSILIPMIALQLEKFGWSPLERIELYLDDEKSEKGRIWRAWDYAREHARVESPALKDLLSHVPNFRNDKELLPLQAADLHAWWIRKRYLEKITGAPETPFPGTTKNNVQYMRVEVTEDQLRQRYFREIISNVTDGFYAPKK
jgi:hypothetical protein